MLFGAISRDDHAARVLQPMRLNTMARPEQCIHASHLLYPHYNSLKTRQDKPSDAKKHRYVSTTKHIINQTHTTAYKSRLFKTSFLPINLLHVIKGSNPISTQRPKQSCPKPRVHMCLKAQPFRSNIRKARWEDGG
jgi:hypothetical protein